MDVLFLLCEPFKLSKTIHYLPIQSRFDILIVISKWNANKTELLFLSLADDLNSFCFIIDVISGQMLMKWFISSLQNNASHLSEQDINVLTLQYCNNLINVGVLKQISEKRDDLDVFSVSKFNM